MIAVASAAGADFVRIKVYVGAMMTPFGIETAQAHVAIKARNAWNAGHVAIFADVHDRTGNPIALAAASSEDLDFAVRLGGADGLVLTGKSYAGTLDFITTARGQLGTVPILVGGGVTSGEFRRGRGDRRRRDRQLLAEGLGRCFRQVRSGESQGVHGRSTARPRSGSRKAPQQVSGEGIRHNVQIRREDSARWQRSRHSPLRRRQKPRSRWRSSPRNREWATARSTT